MTSSAWAAMSVLERPIWGRARYFAGWGAFAAVLVTAVELLLSDAPSAGLADATVWTEYGTHSLRASLAVALSAPLLGALGVAPFLLARAALSAGGWRWDAAPAAAGLLVGAVTLGYTVHLQYAALESERATSDKSR